MPWNERSSMSLRSEFVIFASQPGANIRALCRQFGITPNTAYKWLYRFRQEGFPGLVDHSRRPRHSPAATEPKTVRLILNTVDADPYHWRARKIKNSLRTKGIRCLRSAPCMLLSTNIYLTCHQSYLRHPPLSHSNIKRLISSGRWSLKGISAGTLGGVIRCDRA